MMKKVLFVLSLLISMGFICGSAQELTDKNTRKEAIKKALEYQRNTYLVSQYRDVYKNFMQDFYGPGHMINNKGVACEGIQKEMAGVDFYDGPDYEPTGFQGNFYRVNLRLIEKGIVPHLTFLDAFVESVQAIVPPDPEVWMQTWNEIDDEIKEMGWTFVNEAADRETLNAQFKERNYVVHHSDAYNEGVNFHYRIISRDKFEKIILPLLEAHSDSK